MYKSNYRYILIGFTDEQLEYINVHCGSMGRNQFVRHLVQNQMEMEASTRQQEGEYATWGDIDMLYQLEVCRPIREGVEYAAADGRDISNMIPTFAGLIKKMIKKDASPVLLHTFLEKMMD